MSLKLSCARCNGVQPFSGTPPTCEVCGWVYNFTPKSKTSAGKRLGRFLKGVVAFVVLSVLLSGLSYIAPSLFPESPWAYANKYETSDSHVFVSPRPGDCDFDYRPIGRKGCHYEKIVQVTRYSRDKATGKPIYTTDDGKTWQWDEDRTPGAPDPPPDVNVSWVKVNDW